MYCAATWMEKGYHSNQRNWGKVDRLLFAEYNSSIFIKKYVESNPTIDTCIIKHLCVSFGGQELYRERWIYEHKNEMQM